MDVDICMSSLKRDDGSRQKNTVMNGGSPGVLIPTCSEVESISSASTRYIDTDVQSDPSYVAADDCTDSSGREAIRGWRPSGFPQKRQGGSLVSTMTV